MSDQPSGWAVGWAYFAGTIMMIVGVFQAIAGIAALAKDDVLVVGPKWTLSFNVTTWGWIHLLLGIVLFLVGIGILYGNMAARIVGVVVASLSAIANFVFLPYNPVWAVIVIAVDIAIIWALTAHGRDVKEI